MGVWMKQIPVKLPLETIERVRLFAQGREIPVGMSTAIRHMVEDFLSRMSSGIVQFAAEQGNRIPSVQSIPGTPNEFPSAALESQLGPKPLTRIVAPSSKGVRGRAISHVSRMVSMATVPSGITFFPKHLQLNSTRERVA